jgi:hypothetical protein
MSSSDSKSKSSTKRKSITQNVRAGEQSVDEQGQALTIAGVEQTGDVTVNREGVRASQARRLVQAISGDFLESERQSLEALTEQTEIVQEGQREAFNQAQRANASLRGAIASIARQDSGADDDQTIRQTLWAMAGVAAASVIGVALIR